MELVVEKKKNGERGDGDKMKKEEGRGRRIKNKGGTEMRKSYKRDRGRKRETEPGEKYRVWYNREKKMTKEGRGRGVEEIKKMTSVGRGIDKGPK